MAHSLTLSQYTNAIAKLCKWRVVCLMMLTALVGMCLTPSIYWHTTHILSGLIGITLSACAGGIFNQIFEQQIDKKMARTQHRPLVQSTISTQHACIIGTGFLIVSTIILYHLANPLTALMTLLTMFGYSYIYTKILKPNTSQNIVIGGLFGAMPPLLGWVALTNHISVLPILLVTIIFIWTPSHFWALSLARIEDYKKIQLPVLPVTHGIQCTQIHILAYTILLILTTQLPFLLTYFSYPYLLLANINNLWLLRAMLNVFNSPTQKNCMLAFKRSNVYLLLLFIIMLIDRIL